MGRKRIKAEKPKDRIGESVNLKKCPKCSAYPDCFSNIHGKCTALNSADEGCVFYCPEQKAITEAKMAYHKLKEKRRFDLIRKYIKTFTALGVFDDEIGEREMRSEDQDAFRNDDSESLMRQEQRSI